MKKSQVWIWGFVTIIGASCGGLPPLDGSSHATNMADGGPSSTDAETETETETATPPWIYNDYAAALQKAKDEQKPLMVDFWAKWCPMCVYMNNYILTDPGLKGMYDRFVWVSLDTDDLANEAVVEQYGITFWPSYFVVTPKRELIEGRRHELMSVTAFRDFLKTSLRNYAAGRVHMQVPVNDPGWDTRDGDRKMTAEDWKGAIKAYANALQYARPNWDRRAEVVSSLVSAYYLDGDFAGCADRVLAEMDQIPNGPDQLTVIGFGQWCLDKMERPTAKKEALRKGGTPLIKATLADANAHLSVMDRNGGLELLKGFARAAGNERAALDIAKEQKKLLDEAIHLAAIPWAKMAFVSAQQGIYLELGLGEELVPFMTELVAALPTEMDPIYRFAKLYLSLGKFDPALKAAKKALSLAPETRTPHVYYLIASIYKAQGDSKAAHQAIHKGIAAMKALPKSVQSERFLEILEKEIQPN